MTPETNAKIAIWRQKIFDGTISVEEMKEAILVLRAGRIAAAHASESARRTRAKVEVPSANDLLKEMEGL
jgi:hypothetical protein